MGQFAVGNQCNAFQSSFASVFLIFTVLCLCVFACTGFSGFVGVHAQNIIATATRATHTYMHAYAHMCATGLVMSVEVNLSGCEKSTAWSNFFSKINIFWMPSPYMISGPLVVLTILY